jgi:predicted HD phosphohydrolase
MDDLSPAAQSVLDAATVPTGDFCLENVNEIAAAALRAAADGCDPDWLALTVLHHLHSIADELEAQRPILHLYDEETCD